MKGMIRLKNLNYYPFERNKFFYGKLLTVADFELEQKYMNDKRRFLNRYLFGSGVICGLSTYSVDDSSIMIESGAAIDGSGREIAVYESIIRKLSGIDGYEASSGTVLYLCVEYSEELSDPVYSIAHTLGDATGSSSEFNRVKESFHLFITDKEPEPLPYSLIDDFITRKVIFSNKDITVTQSVPCIISGSGPFNVNVDIVKHTPEQDFSFEYIINTPYFNTQDGSETIRVVFDDLQAGLPGKHTLTYTLTPPGGTPTEASIAVVPQSLKFKVQKGLPALSAAISFDIAVSQEDLYQMIEQKYFSVSMEEASVSKQNSPIYLSRIEIFRSSTAYIIESLKPMPFNQYVYNPQISHLKTRLGCFFPSLAKDSPAPDASPMPCTERNEAASLPAGEPSSSSGIVEIPLGFNPRPKQKFYSEEIMHGLGKGPVTIIMGIESSSVNEMLFRGNFTTYGNPEIFQGSEHGSGLPSCEIAAMNYEERGTFVVGIKLLEAPSALYLKIKWHAVKRPGAPSASPASRQDICLFVKPNTIVVAPRETTYFKPIFYNTGETPCNWTVVEENGGTVAPNGEYTAPNREGVYEINVQSISNPDLKASAFVVVKEKGAS